MKLFQRINLTLLLLYVSSSLIQLFLLDQGMATYTGSYDSPANLLLVLYIGHTSLHGSFVVSQRTKKELIYFLAPLLFFLLHTGALLVAYHLFTKMSGQISHLIRENNELVAVLAGKHPELARDLMEKQSGMDVMQIKETFRQAKAKTLESLFLLWGTTLLTFIPAVLNVLRIRRR